MTDTYTTTRSARIVSIVTAIFIAVIIGGLALSGGVVAQDGFQEEDNATVLTDGSFDPNLNYPAKERDANVGAIFSGEDSRVRVDGNPPDVELDIRLEANQTNSGRFVVDNKVATIKAINRDSDNPAIESDTTIDLDSSRLDFSNTVTLNISGPVGSSAAEVVDGSLEIANQGNTATIDEGESENISADIENVGGESGQLDATLEIENSSGDVVVDQTEQTAELNPGDTETVNFTGVTGNFNPDEYNVTISTNNDPDGETGTLTVQEVGEFLVDIDTGASTLDVNEGEDIEVVVNVTNDGDSELQQDVVAEVAGTQRAINESVTLAGGATSQETLTFEAQASDDGEAVEVSSDDDSDTAELNVTEVGDLTVEIAQASTLDVEEGQDFEVVVNLNNTGDTELQQDITAEVGGTRRAIARDVTLAANAESQETLTFEAQASDDNEDVVVSSDDDSDTAPLTVAVVGELVVDIDRAASDLDAQTGQDFNVEVVIENTGDTELQQNITADVGGTERAVAQDVTLAGGGQTRENLIFTAEASDDGQDVVVSSENTTDTEQLTILEEGQLTVDINTAQSDLDVTDEEDITLVVDLENTGDTQLQQDVVAEVNGDERATAAGVTLAGGEQTQETLSFAANAADDSETVEVSSDDSSDTATLRVAEVGELLLEINETDSTLDVDEGDTIEVVAELNNTGEADLTQDIVANVTGQQRAIAEDVTVTGGAQSEETLTFQAEAADDGEDVEVSSADDTASAPLSVAEVGEFLVEIDEGASNLSTEAGQDFTLQVNITNTGDTQLEQDLEAEVGGTQQTIRQNVALAGGEERSETLTFPAEVDDNGETVTVSSEDGSSTAALNVEGVGELEVAINETESSLDVDEGDNFEVVVDINNTDAAELTQDIRAEIDGEQRTVQSVTVAGNEERTETLSFGARAQDDGKDVEVRSDDDSDTAPLTVAVEGELTVTIDEAASDLAAASGEDYTIEVEIENTGDLELTQDIVANVTGQQRAINQSVTVAGGAVKQETLTFEAQAGDGGQDVEVSSEDDSDTAQLTILEEGEFRVEINESDSNLVVTDQEDIVLTVDLENTGDTQLEQSVIVEVNGMQRAIAPDVTLAGGEQTQETLTFGAEIADDGETVTVESMDDSDNATLTVAEVGELLVEVNEADSTLDVDEGDTIEVVAELTNTGEVTLIQNIVVNVAGEQRAIAGSVAVAPGAQTEETFTFQAEAADDGEDVEVSSADDTASAPLSVQRTGSGLLTSTGGGGGSADFDDDPTPTPEPDTPTPEPDTDTPTPEPDTDTPTPEPDTDTDTPTPEPDTDTPTETPDQQDQGISPIAVAVVVLLLLGIVGAAAYAITQSSA